jgi:hypothetical protein
LQGHQLDVDGGAHHHERQLGGGREADEGRGDEGIGLGAHRDHERRDRQGEDGDRSEGGQALDDGARHQNLDRGRHRGPPHSQPGIPSPAAPAPTTDTTGLRGGTRASHVGDKKALTRPDITTPRTRKGVAWTATAMNTVIHSRLVPLSKSPASC